MGVVVREWSLGVGRNSQVLFQSRQVEMSAKVWDPLSYSYRTVLSFEVLVCNGHLLGVCLMSVLPLDSHLLRAKTMSLLLNIVSPVSVLEHTSLSQRWFLI